MTNYQSYQSNEMMKSISNYEETVTIAVPTYQQLSFVHPTDLHYDALPTHIKQDGNDPAPIPLPDTPS